MASSATPTALSGGTGIASTPANNMGGAAVPPSPENRARRPSQEGNSLFSGLMAHKRNSTDEGSVARRLSLHETQKPQGFVGKMWHDYTRGNNGSSK